MHQFDEGFEPPEDCVLWCRNRTYDIHVLDDDALVDLDWWNRHLREAEHDIRLRGRNYDGKVVEHGQATVLRNDLHLGSDLIDARHNGLGLLFLCAAWRSGHTRRRGARRFPDLSNRFVADGVQPYARAMGAIDELIRLKRLPDYDHTSGAGWPALPNVGVALTTVLAWALDIRSAGGRAQLLDQHGVSTSFIKGGLRIRRSADSPDVAMIGTSSCCRTGRRSATPVPNSSSGGWWNGGTLGSTRHAAAQMRNRHFSEQDFGEQRMASAIVTSDRYTLIGVSARVNAGRLHQSDA